LDAPVGVMPIITNKQTRTAEVIDINGLSLISIVINAYTGIAQFALAFGGYDANGRFHMAETMKDDVAVISLTRQEAPELFDTLFCDVDGNPRCEFDKQFFTELLESLLLKIAYRQWGGKVPDLKASVEGRCCFEARGGVALRAEDGQRALPAGAEA